MRNCHLESVKQRPIQVNTDRFHSNDRNSIQCMRYFIHPGTGEHQLFSLSHFKMIDIQAYASSSCHLLPQKFSSLILQNLISRILFLSLVLPANSVTFNFTGNFTAKNLNYYGDATAAGVVDLTTNRIGQSLTSSTGRATYPEPVRIWDASTRKLTDFTTHFSFAMQQVNDTQYGDGLAFFLAPVDQSSIPQNSSGGYLGLFNAASAQDNKTNQIVAVEFDSNMNDWDPSNDHVGIDVNSIVSVAYAKWPSSIKDGRTANAWVNYNSTSYNLSVFLSYADNPVFGGHSNVSYKIDLREFLPEKVTIGFSASTGTSVETHILFSWDFTSTLEDTQANGGIGLAAGIGIGVGVLFSLSVLGLVLFIWWGKRRNQQRNEIEWGVDEEFDDEAGPKRFAYRELCRVTNNFSEEQKLGEGGFGGVYKGSLTNPDREIAVKRVSRGSKQGRKEYVSEVKIINRLRHRNLVQLLGWCHEHGDLILVYDFMPNGDLAMHLFGEKIPLSWSLRHKIALGLASAVLYLHEEGEQCVLHRDIKSSNVMLDSNFNAKLGDFGLARLIDHELGSQTTVLAGTLGYLAPECFATGKSSRESDVYSFGVVALEIACGRKPVDPRQGPSKVRLVEWVWDLYGKGLLLEAVDKRLEGEFDEDQVERLMVVGLWCCHPDHTNRPSMKQAINVLNFEAPLPNLPSKLPVPVYMEAFTDASTFSYSSTGMTTRSVDTDYYQTSDNSYTTNTHSK